MAKPGRFAERHPPLVDRAIAGPGADWRVQKSHVIEQLLAGVSLTTVFETLCQGLALQAPDSRCCVLAYHAASASFADVVGAKPDDVFAIQAAIEAHDGVTRWRMRADLALCTGLPLDDIDSADLTLSDAFPATGSTDGTVLVTPVFIDHHVFYGVLALIAPKQEGPRPQLPALLQDAARVASTAVRHRLAQDKLRITEIVFEASQSAIIVTDASGRIVSVNPAFTRITGYTLDEVLLQTPRILSSGRHAPEFYKDMWQSLHERGSWQGEICNKKKNGKLYYEWLSITVRRDASGATEGYVGIFTDISDLKHAQQIVSYQASHDSLTDLLNRRACEEAIEHALQRACKGGPGFAILFADLDDFKDINDTLGHTGGDELLRETARRLRVCTRQSDGVRQGDILGRFGVDEFLVIATGTDLESDATAIASKIIQEIGRGFDIGSSVIHITASIGIAVYPEDGEGANALLSCADQALYEAKRTGRGRYVRYSPAISYASQTRAQLKARLKEALRAGQLSVHYQPMVDLASGRPIKAEALVRWRHPELGFVSPATFIPLAEEIGIIDAIGLWVLENALQHWKEWQATALQGMGVSINLSPYQLAAPRFLETVLNVIDNAGVSAESITFEITEGVIVDDRHDCRGKIRNLKQWGATIALDDFGTGYSSLSYIKKYDIDYIKIDKIFVDGIDINAEDRVLVEAMLVMASKLGIQVIVEGVETESQLRTLKNIGANLIQGYYFSKPLQQHEFMAWLADQRSFAANL